MQHVRNIAVVMLVVFLFTSQRVFCSSPNADANNFNYIFSISLILLYRIDKQGFLSYYFSFQNKSQYQRQQENLKRYAIAKAKQRKHRSNGINVLFLLSYRQGVQFKYRCYIHFNISFMVLFATLFSSSKVLSSVRFEQGSWLPDEERMDQCQYSLFANSRKLAIFKLCGDSYHRA